MVCCGDGAVRPCSQFFPRVMSMYPDSLKRVYFQINGLQGQEPREMSEDGHPPVIKNRITIVNCYMTVIHLCIAQTEGKDVTLCLDGGLEKRILKRLYIFTVRCGP